MFLSVIVLIHSPVSFDENSTAALFPASTETERKSSHEPVPFLYITKEKGNDFQALS